MKRKILLATILLFTTVVDAANLTFPQYAALVEKHAAAQQLDAKLVWAVMGRESEGNPKALSNKDARGLMQVIPSTAARMGVNPKYLYIPDHNIAAGTRYLRYLTNYYKGNLDLILAAYNAGEGAVDKYKGIPPYAETRAYVKNVKYRYARLSKNPSLMVASSSQVTVNTVAKPTVITQLETAKAVPVTTQRTHASWDAFQEF